MSITEPLRDRIWVFDPNALLGELATLTRNRVVPAGADERAAYQVLTTPTPVQTRAFELIGVSPGSM